MTPQELAAIVARDATMHPSLWDSWATIERAGGDIGEGNRAVRDRRALLVLIAERRDAEDELYAFMIGLLIGQDRLADHLRKRWDEFRATRP